MERLKRKLNTVKYELVRVGAKIRQYVSVESLRQVHGNGFIKLAWWLPVRIDGANVHIIDHSRI